MPAILQHLATATINDAATKIITARATETTSDPPDYTSPGSIAGFVWFGICSLIVLIGFASACWPILLVVFFPIVLPVLGVKWLYKKSSLARRMKRRKDRNRAARNARVNRQIELSNRGTYRRYWAQEELQRARKERRQPNLPRDWIAELEYGWKMKKRSKFFDLPYEIRLMVYSDFDYGTALNLERVSKFFYTDQPARGVDREQRATFVYHAETFKRNENRLACYGCLRIRKMKAFETAFRTDKFQKFAESELDRRCFECRLDNGDVKWARWWKVVRLMRGHSNKFSKSRR